MPKEMAITFVEELQISVRKLSMVIKNLNSLNPDDTANWYHHTLHSTIRPQNELLNPIIKAERTHDLDTFKCMVFVSNCVDRVGCLCVNWTTWFEMAV